MKMEMFAALDKAKPSTENIKFLKLGGSHLYDMSYCTELGLNEAVYILSIHRLTV
jgi:hypothetical protein